MIQKDVEKNVNQTRTEYAAAILCGGKSARMGRDKATMRVGGERLVDRLIREFSPCAEVLLSVRDEAQARALSSHEENSHANHDVANLQNTCTDGISADEERFSERMACDPKHVNLRFVQDEIVEGGPLAGIAACLRESSQELLFVTAVDMPYMDRQFAEELLALGSNAIDSEDSADFDKASDKSGQDWDALLPVDAGGRLQGLCGFYRKTALPAIQESLAAGEHKVRATLEKLKVKTVEVNRITDGEKKISNWNRVEDLSNI